nr:calcitonin A [Carausius morosus]
MMHAASYLNTMQACLLVLVTSVLATAIATPADLNNDLLAAHMKAIQQHRRTVQMLRDLLNEMDAGMATVQKRTCYVNAGLSHGCDYKDVIRAIDEEKYWRSVNSPGRRRRRAAEVNQARTSKGRSAHKSQQIAAH